MKEFFMDALDIFKSILCNHDYKSKNYDKKSLHSQMVCEKCGKSKYKFEG